AGGDGASPAVRRSSPPFCTAGWIRGHLAGIAPEPAFGAQLRGCAAVALHTATVTAGWAAPEGALSNCQELWIDRSGSVPGDRSVRRYVPLARPRRTASAVACELSRVESTTCPSNAPIPVNWRCLGARRYRGTGGAGSGAARGSVLG